jgi:hypothetical protein
MEVKILCPCGAKYKFDVEPSNGKLPGPVSCPVCNADGTELGNRVIAQLLPAAQPPVPATVAIKVGIPNQAAAPVTSSSGTGRSGFVAPSVPRSSKELQSAQEPEAPAPIPAPAVATVRAVTPTAVASNPAVAPTPGAAPRLSVSVSHATQHTTQSPTPTSAPIAIPVPPSRPSKVQAEPSFTRGVIGIAAASFIGLLIWFAVTYFIGVRFKWIAIFIGAFIGWAGAWLSKEKSVRLGVTAAIATVLVVLVGLLWSARHEAYIAVNETLDEMWTEKLAYAKAAVQASRSDAELLKFITENGTGEEEFTDDEDEDEPSPQVVRASVSPGSNSDAKMLSDFKRNELPKLRKLADGKVSKSQFDRENRPALETVYTFAFIIFSTFRIKVLIFMGLAVGAAWKLTSGQ